MSLTFMAACNDWRNGDPTGKFEHSEVTRTKGGCIVELEHLETSVGYNPKRLTLRIGRLVVPCPYVTTWLGNWCWDGFSVSEESAAQILNYLRQKREAHCIGGDTEVFDKINGKLVVEGSDFAEVKP